MFKVIGKKGNKYGVKDTKDGVVEWYTANEILAVQKKFNLKIDGIEKLLEQKKTKPVRKTDLTIVMNLLLGKIRRAHSYDYEDITVESDDSIQASFRWWGDWNMPEYNPEDFDDYDDYEMQSGDYDWEELDPAWAAKMRDIIGTFKKEYPDLRFEWNAEEKNYIYIYITRRG